MICIASALRKFMVEKESCVPNLQHRYRHCRRFALPESSLVLPLRFGLAQKFQEFNM